MVFTKKFYNHLFFISVLIMIIPIVSCCDTTIDTMGCQFQVSSKNSSSCTSLDLLYCQWKDCDYYVKDKKNHTSCGHYSMKKSSSWGTCMSQCCRGSDGHQTYETLSQCYEENKKIAIIIGSVVGGIIGLILLIILIYCGRQYIARFFGAIVQCIRGCCKSIADGFRNCFRCFFKQQQKIVSEGQIYIMNDPIIPKTQQQQMTKTQQIDNEEGFNSKQACSICSKDLITIRLQCNHAYHHQCINQWIYYKNVCYVCSREIANITIYCKECMKKTKSISLSEMKDKSSPVVQFCENCS